MTPHPTAHSRICLSLLPALGLLLPSCIADNSHRPDPPQAPANARPGRIVPATSGAFEDTDGNMYRDSSTVIIYTMAEASQYAIPIRPKGEFLIRLEDAKGNLIASWTFTKEQTAAATRNLPPGPGCIFELDLRKSPLTGRSDRINKAEASMVVSLKTEDGDTLTARTSSPILIGPIENAR